MNGGAFRVRQRVHSLDPEQTRAVPMIDTELKKRRNTKLEAEGAEFMVLGMLLVEGIHCFKAYTNFPGYDLVAVNPASQKTARIQVKSRWAADGSRKWPAGHQEKDCRRACGYGPGGSARRQRRAAALRFLVERSGDPKTGIAAAR
jgi:hypothetical protein